MRCFIIGPSQIPCPTSQGFRNCWGGTLLEAGGKGISVGYYGERFGIRTNLNPRCRRLLSSAPENTQTLHITNNPPCADTSLHVYANCLNLCAPSNNILLNVIMFAWFSTINHYSVDACCAITNYFFQVSAAGCRAA